MDDYLYDRQRIDPKREYPSEEMRNVEIVALRVLEQSPFADVTRTRDVIQLDIDDEEGITVLVTRESIELRFPTIEWTKDPHGPARTSRLWKRLKTEGLDDIKLAYWLDAARQERQKEFRTCHICKKKYPPEYLFDKNTCQGCAERHLGIVF